MGGILTQTYIHMIRTDLNTSHKGKHTCRSRLYRIVKAEFATKITTKWKPGLELTV